MKKQTGIDGLSSREREVLVLVAAGLTNKETASRLKISAHTAKYYLGRAMTKLGVKTRIEAAVTIVTHVAFTAGKLSAQSTRIDVSTVTDAFAVEQSEAGYGSN